jgi:uncharacterized protein YndB with AHSA1/START domain
MAAPEMPLDQLTIEEEIHIAAPPERVFQALVDPGQLAQWWGQKGMYRSKRWTTDVRPGGKWRSEGTGERDGQEYQYEVYGEYLQVDPPRLLEFTWSPSWAGPMNTVVRMELTPSGEGTLLRLRHSGFTSATQVQSHRGWPQVLGWLRGFIEKGETAETRPALPSTGR